MPRPEDPRDDGRWIRAALERWEQPLGAYATRVLGGDVDRARDVVQETFLRLCKQDEDDVADHLSEWLFTVARNLALDVQRKESRMNPIGEDEARGTATTESPTAGIEEQDTLSHVLGTLACLPEKQQEVLRLKFQHGLSYKEIARVMDESIGNVGWLIHVGIRNLRGRLAGEGAEA